MNYYLNEYSLRGQFKDIDEFFCSLRNYTLPVLKKIQSKEENVIWKNTTLWQAEICNGIPLGNIPRKKNERSGEFAAFQIQLMKLAHEKPFWSENGEEGIEVKEYKFDEGYRDYFEDINCFIKAIEDEGRVVSFIHAAYRRMQLPIVIKHESGVGEYLLENIYTTSWWENEPEIRTWRVENKFLIEIRANEYSYHPPHFHVSSNEFAAVFRLRDGKLFNSGKKKWLPQMLTEVKLWYEEHREELLAAWDNLHRNGDNPSKRHTHN